jgi:diguanylate cyclase (GGDEF)-like protein
MSVSVPTVLVYEFSIDGGEPVAAMLAGCSDLPATVTVANDEAGALGMCRSGRVDCIVLGQDGTLAEGLALAARVRQIGPTASPAIVLIAREDDEPAAFAAAGNHDVDDYLVRAALNRWRLGQTVRGAIGRRALRRELAAVGCELDRVAQTDPLTGLANVRVFEQRLDHAVEIALRRQSNICLLMVDIDDFARVNEAVGRKNGDQVLSEVGRRLAGLARKSDTVARFGGDEFALIMETGSTADGAKIVAERIIERVRAPIEIGGQEIALDVSVGISMLGTEDGKMAVRQAGQALSAAKSGGGGYSIYAQSKRAVQTDRASG